MDWRDVMYPDLSNGKPDPSDASLIAADIREREARAFWRNVPSVTLPPRAGAIPTSWHERQVWRRSEWLIVEEVQAMFGWNQRVSATVLVRSLPHKRIGRRLFVRRGVVMRAKRTH